MEIEPVSAPQGQARLRTAGPLHADDRPSIPALRLATPESPERVILEKRIAARFAGQYGATIEHFLPFLLSLDVAGQSAAIAGLRPAVDVPLFLEQYLETSIEQALSHTYKRPVVRSQIVEIGNLASQMPGAASILFSILPVLLEQAGIRWIACTATPQVRSILKKLGFSTQELCSADPSILGDKLTAWGSYYEARPVVIAGHVQPASELSRGNREVARILRILAPSISQFAAALRAARL